MPFATISLRSPISAMDVADKHFATNAWTAFRKTSTSAPSAAPSPLNWHNASKFNSNFGVLSTPSIVNKWLHPFRNFTDTEIRASFCLKDGSNRRKITSGIAARKVMTFSWWTTTLHKKCSDGTDTAQCYPWNASAASKKRSATQFVLFAAQKRKKFITARIVGLCLVQNQLVPTCTNSKRLKHILNRWSAMSVEWQHANWEILHIMMTIVILQFVNLATKIYQILMNWSLSKCLKAFWITSLLNNIKRTRLSLTSHLHIHQAHRALHQARQVHPARQANRTQVCLILMKKTRPLTWI